MPNCGTKFIEKPEKYQEQLAKATIHQVHCPVSGRLINPKVMLKVEDGKTVYFCCENCLAKYRAEPTKYVEVLLPVAGLIAYGPMAKDDLIICPGCASKGGIHRRVEIRPIVYKGIVYGTCNDECIATFRARPDANIKIVQRTTAKHAGGDRWFTCGMHPAVLARIEGSCPVCNMRLTALVPAE